MKINEKSPFLRAWLVKFSALTKDDLSSVRSSSRNQPVLKKVRGKPAIFDRNSYFRKRIWSNLTESIKAKSDSTPKQVFWDRESRFFVPGFLVPVSSSALLKTYLCQGAATCDIPSIFVLLLRFFGRLCIQVSKNSILKRPRTIAVSATSRPISQFWQPWPIASLDSKTILLPSVTTTVM